MARYIDADALVEELESLQVTVTGLRCGKGVLNEFVKEYRKSVIKIVQELPTADVVEVVRCKDCIHSEELAKHCEINRKVYRHCKKQRGEEVRNVWHKYTKYYRDYNIVDCEGFCSSGKERR